METNKQATPENTQATLEVVKRKDTAEKRKAQLMAIAEQLKTKIENREKELGVKKYIIKGGELTGKHLIAFIENDAQWKFSEALGIGECHRQLVEAVSNIKKVKELFVPALALEALYYFLTKVEGKGLSSANDYLNNLLKPITDALGRSKSDREALDQLIRDLGTIESAIDTGLSIENEDSLVKEIEAELKNEA
jgi:hypothetical protein